MSNTPYRGQYLIVEHGGREVSAQVIEVGAANVTVQLPDGKKVSMPLAGITPRELGKEIAMEREKGS